MVNSHRQAIIREQVILTENLASGYSKDGLENKYDC